WLPVAPTTRLHRGGTALDRRNYTAIHHDTNAAFYASFDGGATWSEFIDTRIGVPLNDIASAVAFGPGGETYLLRSTALSPWPELQFGVSNDGGLTEPTWTSIPGGYDPSIAVDTTVGPDRGTIYVASADYYFAEGSYYQIHVLRSSDGGQNWSDVEVSDGNPTDAYHFSS